MVRFLKYEKKAFIDKVRERNVKRLMMVITLVTFIPSVVIGFHMVRVSLFEAAADKYVAQVFKFPHTRVIECNKRYAHGTDIRRRSNCCSWESRIGDGIIENARAQMRNFGLEKVELVVRQAQHDGRDRCGVAAAELPRTAGGEEPAHRRDDGAAETLPGYECRSGRHFARGGCHDARTSGPYR